MTILDLLTKASGIPVDKLKTLIQAGAETVPDLAADADKIIAELDAALSPEAIGNLVTTVGAEIKNIASGKFDGREHPSDAA